MKRFTKAEDQFLKLNYLNMTLQELGGNLDRTFGSVSGRLNRLGLFVPEKIKKERQKEGLKKGWEVSHNTQFKKGQKAWNKGIKGLNLGGVETQFKKGNIPHNTKYDGSERITKDGYIEVKVSSANWRLKQRVVWEEINGEITKGYIIKFKDGNRQNTDIDNLYMVTKSENMRTNTINRYPKELITTIRNINKLEKSIQNERN